VVSALDATTDRLWVAEFHAAAHALRTCALDLLSEASSNGHASTSGELAPAVARLQSVTNELGAVERLLKPDPAAPDLEGATPSTDGSAPSRNGDGPPPSRDTATVLALAATTVPLSSSEIDEAERWLRALRLHGRVGAALHSLGVSAYQLPTIADVPGGGGWARPVGRVETVSELAREFARLHRSHTVDTVHVLFAVFAVHGARFDRALYAHGTTRRRLLDRLATGVSLPS
jgi:hypothetical protein